MNFAFFFIEDKEEIKKEATEPPRPESRGVDWKTQVRELASVVYNMTLLKNNIVFSIDYARKITLIKLKNVQVLQISPS